MNFEKFVMLTEKYAPSFHFDKNEYLVVDECSFAIASFNTDRGYDSEFPYGTVAIAYNFDFDVDDYSLYVVNLKGQKLKKWGAYDILEDEDSIATRLARLKRRYHECVKEAKEFRDECEEIERKEEEEKFGLPTISW